MQCYTQCSLTTSPPSLTYPSPLLIFSRPKPTVQLNIIGKDFYKVAHFAFTLEWYQGVFFVPLGSSWMLCPIWISHPPPPPLSLRLFPFKSTPIFQHSSLLLCKWRFHHNVFLTDSNKGVGCFYSSRSTRDAGSSSLGQSTGFGHKKSKCFLMHNIIIKRTFRGEWITGKFASHQIGWLTVPGYNCIKWKTLEWKFKQ